MLIAQAGTAAMPLNVNRGGKNRQTGDMNAYTCLAGFKGSGAALELRNHGAGYKKAC